MKLKWVLRNEKNNAEAETFANQLNISSTIARILLNRGIDSFESARRFFRAEFNELHDPFLLNNMERAVNRLIEVIKNHEKLMIFGDYDVDGVTSVALFLRVLRDELGYEPQYYIPNRQREGYGISAPGIEHAKKHGISLIITVDCGITAREEIALANEYGIDVIITDHHEPGGSELPEAYAILDPKCKDERYPFNELAGVGVTFKLLQALFIQLKLNQERLLKYLQFVALGSAADIVPLVDENRIIVRLGLQELSQSENVGIQALVEMAGLQQKKLGTGQVVFMIAPRINAVGRLGDASRAVNLLTTNNRSQAKNIAAVLDAENRKRKTIDEKTFEDALGLIARKFDAKQDPAFVLDMNGWHSGVIGIVASRVVEKYYRPTIMIAVENGIGKGSARSISGFDLYRALSECQDELIGFGGHKYAAGLTIKAENVDSFRKRFIEIAAGMLDEEMLLPKLRIESEITLEQINGKFVRILKQFAPYGPQNMRPVFVARNLQAVGTPKIVGKNHLKFKVKQGAVIMDAIGFNLGHLKYRLAPGEKNLDIAFVIEENEWMGHITIQLQIKDMI